MSEYERLKASMAAAAAEQREREARWAAQIRGGVADPFVSAARVVEVARQHAVASATRRRPPEDYSEAAAVARRLHDDAAALAEACPQFNPAWSANIGGLPVVALTPDGTEPVAAPTRDLNVLVRHWTENPDAPAGLACGREHDHLSATFDEDGYRRLIELASPVLAKRDDNDFGIQRRMLDHGGGFVQLQERKPPVTMRTAFAFNQDAEASQQVNEWAKEASIQVRGYSLVWRWPLGTWDRLDEPRRCARGTRIVAAVPLPGSVVERDGKQWNVVTSPMSRWGPCPDWVAADVLGGKLREAVSA